MICYFIIRFFLPSTSKQMIDLMIILQKMFIYIIQTPVHHGYLHLK